MIRSSSAIFPLELTTVQAIAYGVVLGANGEGAIIWNTTNLRLEHWNGSSWQPLSTPKSVARAVTGVVDVAQISLNLGSGLPTGEPNQWIIEPGGSLQIVLVTAAGDPNAGFWLWRDVGDWERPSGMGAADLLPNGITAYVARADVPLDEWFVYGAGVDAFTQNGVSNVFAFKKPRLRRVSDVLTVDPNTPNLLSDLTRTPQNLSTARIIAGTGVHIPTQLDPTRGAFTLGGANNRVVTWLPARAFELTNSNFPVVYIDYDVLE
jgi:hypothetical protein